MVSSLRRDPLAVARYLRAALPAPEEALPALCRRGIEPDFLSTMLQSLAAEAAASDSAAAPAAQPTTSAPGAAASVAAAGSPGRATVAPASPAAAVATSSASPDYSLRFLRGLAGTGGWDMSVSMLESADRDAALRLLRSATAGPAAAPKAVAGAPAAAVGAGAAAATAAAEVAALAAAFRIPIERVHT
jgi:hypothetical protein